MENPLKALIFQALSMLKKLFIKLTLSTARPSVQAFNIPTKVLNTKLFKTLPCQTVLILEVMSLIVMFIARSLSSISSILRIDDRTVA